MTMPNEKRGNIEVIGIVVLFCGSAVISFWGIVKLIDLINLVISNFG